MTIENDYKIYLLYGRQLVNMLSWRDGALYKIYIYIYTSLTSNYFIVVLQVIITL